VDIDQHASDDQDSRVAQPNQNEAPLPKDDQSAVDEDMTDVDATNSVSTEHPAAGGNGGIDEPAAKPLVHDPENTDNEPRGVPASDPESGA
jgi:hypothetical protein